VHSLSGVVDNIVQDEAQAFSQMRRFLSFLPSSASQLPPRTNVEDPPDRCDEALLTVVPEDRRTSFDMGDVVRAVVDTGSFFEIGATYGPSIRVGLARIAGQSIGVVANDCRYVAGAMTAEGAQKLTRMVRLCEQFHLPVVNFVDEPGFMIGPEAERTGTIRYGMDAVLSAARATVPWAAVQVHKSFGVAAAAHYGPQAYVLSWPSAETGALPVEGGVAVAFGRQIAKSGNPEKARRELEEKLASARSPFPAAESFAVHELIDPRNTRPMLCEWVEWIAGRLEERVAGRTPDN
jgi:acetyl-CoA carboxylase carboxyltransferase component